MSLRAISMLFSLLVATVGFAAEAPAAPTPPFNAWLPIAPFAAGSREMSCANHSAGGEWTVASIGGQLEVHPFEHPSGPPLMFALPRGSQFERPSSSLEVTDGVLVGFDRGEWGGGLSWFAPDGSSNYRVVDSNILAVVASARGVIAFGGLAHLGMDDGRVYELRHDRGRWQVAGTLDIGAAPAVVATSLQGDSLVVTTTGLSRYAAGSIRRVHSSDYTRLYPNSLVAMPDGTLYIGMRHVIARLASSEKGYQETWLVRPDCAALSIVDGPMLRCSCRAKP